MSTITKALIIDDCPVNSFLTEKALVKFDSDIGSKKINCPLEALTYLYSIFEPSKKDRTVFIPDVIFLDIDMPLMNGFQFLDALEKFEAFVQNPIDIYVLSSSCLQKDIQTALNKSLCKGYMIKPLIQHNLNVLFSHYYSNNSEIILIKGFLAKKKNFF